MAKQENVTEQHMNASGGIEELNLILARMGEAMRQQNAPAPTSPKPDPLAGYESVIAQGQEYQIDDARGLRQRPQMVIDDEVGWKKIAWDY